MNETISIIVNKKSRGGRGAEIFREIEAELKNRGVRYDARETLRTGDGIRLAATICKSTFTGRDEAVLNLIVIGGDGTINEVVNGITDISRVRLGVIPTGSGNDFAREIGLSGTPVERIRAILSDLEEGRISRVLDMGQVHYGKGKTRKYCCSCGLGMDAMSCKLVERSRLKKVLNALHIGSAIYVLETVKALFTMQTAQATVSYNGKEETYDKMIFTSPMNFKAEGGGVRMCPQADPCDGLLSVCLVNDVPKWKTFFLLIRLAMAKHEKLRCFHFMNTSHYEVRLNVPMCLHTDGEYIGDYSRLSFECLPAALHMIG